MQTFFIILLYIIGDDFKNIFEIKMKSGKEWKRKVLGKCILCEKRFLIRQEKNSESINYLLKSKGKIL